MKATNDEILNQGFFIIALSSAAMRHISCAVPVAGRRKKFGRKFFASLSFETRGEVLGEIKFFKAQKKKLLKLFAEWKNMF